MSLDKPTEKQLEAFKHLHRKNMGFMTNLFTNQRVSDDAVLFCDHCKVEWPCKSMKVFGVKA